jgi:CRISP-associated protein Cas1
MNTSTNDYIPVSYLNAFVYCPRRFYLEYVRGMFEDNTHTVDGRSSHHVVDLRSKEGKPSRKEDMIHRRSVFFSSETLGIIGKLDLLEEDESGNQYPVEYKKGKKPKDRSPWLNDQVQVCAQALLMHENGLQLPNKGFVYYIASKARAEVPFTEDLIS